MTAASTGVISVFLQNQHYPSHEEYIAALADVMKAEYDEIHRTGIVLQLDCPDLAMTRHMQSDESLEEFRRRAKLHVEAINHATRDIPADDMRLHLCWGNYEGPHHHDMPLRDISTSSLRPSRRRSPSRPQTRATNTSGPSMTDVQLPEGDALIPGVLDSTHQLHRAPRPHRPATRPLRTARRPRERDRRQRLRLRNVRQLPNHRPRDHVGQATRHGRRSNARLHGALVANGGACATLTAQRPASARGLSATADRGR